MKGRRITLAEARRQALAVAEEVDRRMAEERDREHERSSRIADDEAIDRIEELLRRMTPEKRTLFESIRARREEIGPVGFDIVEALREMREGD